MEYSEEELISSAKKWWKENGNTLMTGLVLGIALLAGGRYWLTYQENQNITASAEYNQLQEEFNNENSDAVKKRSQHIVTNFSGTPYAITAALTAAAQAVKDNDLDKAQQELEWVKEHASSLELTYVASLRLARVNYEKEQYQSALDELNVGNVGGFTSSFEQLKGDIYVAMGEPALAKTAYLLALENVHEGADTRALENKIADAGIN